MEKAYRYLDKLKPSFRSKVEAFLKECPEVFVVESWRSPARQKELIKAKLSFVSHSNHQDGEAIDIGFNGNELYPTDFRMWRKVADVAKKHGIDWGYDLWKWDKPHFQDNGLPIVTTLEKQNMSNKFKDLLDGLVKQGYKPVFASHEGENQLNEGEIRTLIEIALARSK